VSRPDSISLRTSGHVSVSSSSAPIEADVYATAPEGG
jgi:hypothetical protein